MAQHSEAKDEEPSGPGTILHVVVVGFHHKRGCQVDFSYPPLIADETSEISEVPSEWKHLPFLALPDGAHNYEEDTIYFHLPGRGKHMGTVYGVSCYRQIKTQDLLSKTADVTRGTVQKSVCVLSKLPLYGVIQAKLQLITHAYFCERDFSKTKILQEFYESLNSSVPRSMPTDSQVFLGLSLRELVLTFKHKVLVLFKLMLLERRILFYTSPVHKLCNALLAIVSLFPGMIERGLDESACPRHYCPRISSIELQDYGIDTNEYLDVKMSHVPNYRRQKSSSLDESQDETPPLSPRGYPNSNTNQHNGEALGQTAKYPSRSGSVDKENIPGGMDTQDRRAQKVSQSSTEDPISPVFDRDMGDDLLAMIDKELYGSYFEEKKLEENSCSDSAEHRNSVQRTGSPTKGKDSSNSGNTIPVGEEQEPQSPLHRHSASIQSGDSGIGSCLRTSTMDSHRSQNSTSDDPVREMKIERYSGAEDFVVLPSVPPCEPRDVDDYGFPLAIFGKGSLCHPYMSLQQHDMLQDVNVRSFVIGATNALFKHHRHLMDVIVEVEEGKVTVFDAELRKQLALSTADLRFADFLIKHVSEHSADVFLDGTGWEGSDEWIRAQFKLYLLSLLSTCTSIGTYTQSEIGDFNECFVHAWKTTHNFRMWNSKVHDGIDKIHTGHPFHGHISVSDMKIRLQSVMQTTDRGKRINHALNRTGTAVMHTGKVVGDALTSAKSAVSSWLYGLANEWKEEG
ncbi:late secretory pathway protein AVL9 homolog [Diadema antillarum]|uniref:late secretory pathway protein AVL9 homolog n=1 Tax=Diadema antillarum TaxID=105358 RepID=UPI003A885B58